MVAISYVIENEKHPFHYLNGSPDCVEVDKVLEELDKNQVIFIFIDLIFI